LSWTGKRDAEGDMRTRDVAQRDVGVGAVVVDGCRRCQLGAWRQSDSGIVGAMTRAGGKSERRLCRLCRLCRRWPGAGEGESGVGRRDGRV
jgi:hypothetical protein